LKTRHKITLLFSLIVTSILLVVSLSVYYFSSFERKEIFHKRLKSRANNNAQVYFYGRDTSGQFLDRINTRSMELLPDKTVDIYFPDGKINYKFRAGQNDSVFIKPGVIRSAIMNGEYFFEIGRREALAVNYNEGTDGGIVVVITAYDLDGWTQLQRLRHIFMVSMLIGCVISLIAGNVFSKQLLKPVAQMIREVNNISSHNLSHRLKVGVTQDELSQLANTFNDLLDRLEEYFAAQRRFISNASHELSTPLTSISSQLEVTLQRERGTEEYRQVMQSVQEDVVQMRQLTKSLLEIAKTGSEGGIELNDVRIDEILFKVMGDMRKINTDYVVELDFLESDEPESNFLVFGNADLLYIAVKNIVENGCKYSPDHTSKVDLSFADHATLIEVKSIGQPIRMEEIEKIFQPFYRAETSAGTHGFGLGLALAKRIVALHKGTLKMSSDKASGTVFTIVLPNGENNH
jgi:two-component system sensor histidine kinase ArlS